MEKKIHIIGAGLAGLSAAYHLAKNGHSDITIYEATPNAGGRCRSYFDEKLQADVDNGNHLIMGANTNVLEIIKALGVENKFNKFDDRIFTFFDNRNNQRYYYKAPLPDIERFSVLNILNLFKFLLIPTNKTVRSSFRFSPNIYYKIINPVSRSILNTSSERANSNILRKVFLKLAFSKHGFHHYYPEKSWGDALINPLLKELENLGAKINFNSSIKKLKKNDQHIEEIVFDDRSINTSSDIVILATTPQVASKLTDIIMPNRFSAIINVHYKLPHHLPPQLIGVINSNVEWIFVKPDMISTTYSAATLSMNDNDMAVNVWRVCSKVLGLEGKLPPHRVLIEKRATFAATRNQLRKRPKQITKYKNLFLAGDYVATNMPATIESAILSGKNIAKILK